MNVYRKLAERWQPVYAHNDWRWGFGDGAVPTVDELAELIECYALEARDFAPLEYVTSGRILARREPDGGIEVSMVADTEWFE